jgi:hypothetical protein
MAAIGWCDVLDGRRADAPELLAERASALWADAAERGRRTGLARGTVDGRGAERVAGRLIALVRKRNGNRTLPKLGTGGGGRQAK